MSEITGEKQTKRRWNFKIALLTVGGVVLTAVLAAGLVLLVVKEPQDPKAEAKQTSKRILAEVEKVYLTPQDDPPTVAAIEDKDKLPQQEFFKRAEKGDYLIIYPKSQFAILYRDSVDKIVHAGPVKLPEINDANQ